VICDVTVDEITPLKSRSWGRNLGAVPFENTLFNVKDILFNKIPDPREGQFCGHIKKSGTLVLGVTHGGHPQLPLQRSQLDVFPLPNSQCLEKSCFTIITSLCHLHSDSKRSQTVLPKYYFNSPPDNVPFREPSGTFLEGRSNSKKRHPQKPLCRYIVENATPQYVFPIPMGQHFDKPCFVSRDTPYTPLSDNATQPL